MNISLRKVLIILSIIAALPLTVFAINTVSTGFQVGSNAVSITAHSVCQVVSSKSSTNFFVPTKTSSEWSSFRANYPTGSLNVNACSGGGGSATLAQYESFCGVGSSSGGTGAGGDLGCEEFWSEYTYVEQSNGRYFCVTEYEAETNQCYNTDRIDVDEMLVNGSGNIYYGGYSYENNCTTNPYGTKTCDNGADQCSNAACALP